MIIWLCLAAFLSTCFFTYLIRRYALAKSLVDIPNARSSHSIPTPRGGGLSIVIVCLFFLSILSILNIEIMIGYITVDPVLLKIIIASLFVAGIGFWDDHQHIPARWRLLVHFGSALLVLLSLPAIPTIPVFGINFQANFLVYGFYIFALVWLLNLYNFMDGIDGIASIEAITVALSAAVLLFVRGESDSSLLLLLLSSSIAGFLVWNFPHAKIFMGDACSGFLGFSLGVLALITSATGAINIWSWLILLGVFITDATLTLIRRILKGEVWYEAHSSHAYQHYARKLIHTFQQQGFEHHGARTKSHRRVNLMLTLVNVFWLLPLAAAATFYPFWAALIAFIAFIPLIFIAHSLKAGIRE